MATRMQQRRGTAAQWTAANPILAAGEIGFETDTSKFKMGNGSSTWTALQYFANASELAAIIGDGAMPALLNSLDELAQAIGDDPQFYLTVGQNLTNHQNDSTMVHGIADTALLATTGDVNTAATGAATALSAHEADTTLVHGIANTALLATLSDVEAASTAASSSLSTHNSDTTDVHGIADTSVLATVTAVSTAKSEAIADAATTADSKISTHNSDTTDVHGIGDTSLLATTADILTHNLDTTDVHGIADTSLLATTADISTHNLDTTDVHGIADTSLLVTQQQLTDAVSGAEVDQASLAGVGIDWNTVNSQFDIDPTVATKTYADDAVSTHNLDTTDVHGIADTSLLATTADISTHNSDTLDVHGIANTAQLETQIGAQAKADSAVTAAGTAADSKVAAAVAALTKSSVGLGNVDNTSDANKPVSTATQTALDAKASLAGAVFTGNVEVDGNLVVDGDFTVNGTNFSASATSITIEDNMVQLAHQNAANTVDLGLVVAYNDGSAKHAGIVRDVSDAKWKLFKDVSTEPSTVVAFGEGSLDALAVGALEATTVTPSQGVVFSDGTQTKEGTPSRTPIISKTDSYTLSALTERDSLVEVAKATATTITIPTDATLNFPVGTSIDILQTSTGQVTIAGAVGVTVNATPGLKLRTTWSSATLFKRAANTWVVYGDLTA